MPRNMIKVLSVHDEPSLNHALIRALGPEANRLAAKYGTRVDEGYLVFSESWPVFVESCERRGVNGDTSLVSDLFEEESE